jgi:hypothetical protein
MEASTRFAFGPYMATQGRAETIACLRLTFDQGEAHCGLSRAAAQTVRRAHGAIARTRALTSPA